MNNFVQEGNALDLVAPTGGVVGGKAYLIGSILVIAATTVVAGQLFAGWTEGVYDVNTDTGAAWAVGDKIYLLADGSAFTKTATSNTKAGYAIAAKASGATTGRVRLVPTI
jgi:predicted RecA/RadA family phage recombinase